MTKFLRVGVKSALALGRAGVIKTSTPVSAKDLGLWHGNAVGGERGQLGGCRSQQHGRLGLRDVKPQACGEAETQRQKPRETRTKRDPAGSRRRRRRRCTEATTSRAASVPALSASALPLQCWGASDRLYPGSRPPRPAPPRPIVLPRLNPRLPACDRGRPARQVRGGKSTPAVGPASPDK